MSQFSRNFQTGPTGQKKRFLPSKEAVEIALAEEYLDHFVKQAWKILEPRTPLRWGWHLDAIVEHLTAVTNGELTRLIINIPPRHMKSLMVSVFWPVWRWIKEPTRRYLFSSYAQELSVRDSLKRRNIIRSNWFQSRWSHKFSLVGDQNMKTRFENDKRGYSVATSVGGMVTGEGGDDIVVDDPHNVKDGESEARRIAALQWWDESMSTRANDPRTSSKIIVMQRIHEADLTGHILSKKRDFAHLCLPARYEGKSRVKTSIPLGNPFSDPRTYEGEVLWEEKYPDDQLTALEEDMSEYAVAGQLQQRPAPRGGGMFKEENFRITTLFDRERILASIRYWDKAATEDAGKRTAGVLMHRLDDGTFIVEDVVKGQWSYGKREVIIIQTARRDKFKAVKFSSPKVHIWVEQEPGSGGKESAQATVKRLAGYVVRADKVTGDKETRAEPFAVQVENQNVYLLKSDWNENFIEEHCSFPTGRFTDQVDAASGAFNKLSKNKKAGTWGRV